jgi:hypothetical protein
VGVQLGALRRSQRWGTVLNASTSHKSSIVQGRATKANLRLQRALTILAVVTLTATLWQACSAFAASRDEPGTPRSGGITGQVTEEEP